ncbi:MAG: hypothetical protein JNM39_11290 [Bdellovibrionaceae bacterium]|nr:hypothetical protein [Pseudobdellovibrionaceae bacterium]
MTLHPSLPNHPLLISATRSRLKQRLHLMIRKCQQFEALFKNQQIHPWDLVHHQILTSLTSDLDKNIDQRIDFFKKLTGTYPNLQLSNSFLFRYELSGLLIRHRQYGLALEEALHAVRLSFDSNSSISSEINAVICQEALGFEVSSKLDRLGLEISKLPKKSLNPKIYSEYHALCLRLYFREGRIDRISNYQGANVLYLDWLKHLPQLGFDLKKLKFSSNKTQAYYEFVCNTILYRCPPEDLISPPINHMVNRLYLWTWTSVVHPWKVPIRSVLQILLEFHTDQLTNSFTAEDKIMLCHCILLISLFDPFSRKQALRFVDRLGPLQYNSHPFLRMERGFIDDLTSTLSKGFEAKNSGDYCKFKFFGQVYPFEKNKIAGFLPGLNLNFLQTQPFDSSKIAIDLAHCRVWDLNHKKWIFSENLASGFIFFCQRQRMSAVNVVEFMESVFGIPSYDEFVHYRNVHNILFRMKSMSLGAFNFSIRRQIISFQIDVSKFDPLEFENRAEFDQGLWRQVLSRINKDRQVTQTTSIGWEKIILQLQLHGPLNRFQLQNAAGFSKAKTVRALNKMLQLKKIQRLGVGKTSQYKLAGSNNTISPTLFSQQSSSGTDVLECP